jgi:N-acyl-L-homoserine lactone synthetase
MIHVVTSSNRSFFADQVRAMHRDRRRIFVDKLGWDVPVSADGLEIDQFDNEDAAYLVALDDSRTRHLGSVRLLPSTKPHILGTAFPDLCGGEVPMGQDVWEITRFCVSPDIRDYAINTRIQRALAIGMVEFALLFEITTYTFVTHLGWLPLILSLGWDAQPLGLPAGEGRQAVGAAKLNIMPSTLSLFREQWDFRQPVLHLDLDQKLAA